MSTTYSANLKLGTPAIADTSWSTVLDANRAILDALTATGGLAVTMHEIPSTSLNVAVSAGNYAKQDGSIATYAGSSSQAVTTATTNYVFLDLTASGALTVNTTGFPTTAHVRLAKVVAGASTITSISDQRVAYTVLGSIVDGTAIPVGTSTGLQIATSSTQKLGFFGATPVVRPTMGAATAGATYTSAEQAMLNAVYSAVRTLGLGS
jgi:hypothetical protein